MRKKRKEIIAVTRVYIRDKTHVDFHKAFTSTFSAYKTSILKILLYTNTQDGYKMNRFRLSHSSERCSS